MKGKIQTQEAYEATMKEINRLMKIGEDKISDADASRLKQLSEAAETFEDNRFPMPISNSLKDIVMVRCSQMGINQSYAAALLGVSDTKLSQILNGKQKPDGEILKAIRDKMKIDANVLLDCI